MRGISIRGVDVSYRHRDIKHVNDAEYREIETLVDDEIRRTHGEVTAIVITTDHVRWGCRYVVDTRHEDGDRGEAELPDREDGR